MPYYDREQKILDILYSCDSVELTELAGQLFVSLPTLRRDLIRLEKKGLAIRGHGKVSPAKNSADAKIPFALRENEQTPAKNIIAKTAASYVKEGYTVMLDASTSAYCMVPYLADIKNIIVITSGAKTAMLLAHYGITTVCTGGKMLNKSLSYIGYDAASTLERYNADIAFFSCRGLTNDGIPTDSSAEENHIRSVMMKQSAKKYLLCDGHKIGKVYLNNLCRYDDLDGIISDVVLPEKLDALQR